MARNGHQFVVENLREEMMVDKFEEILDSMLG
jgi:hypothetical protein